MLSVLATHSCNADSVLTLKRRSRTSRKYWLIESVWSVASLDPNEIPFIRKLYKEKTIQDDRSAFQGARQEAQKYAEEFSRARKQNDVSSTQRVMNDHKEMISLDKYADKLSKYIKLMRDQQDAVRLDKNLTISEKRLKLKELENHEAKIYDQYLDVFDLKKTGNEI